MTNIPSVPPQMNPYAGAGFMSALTNTDVEAYGWAGKSFGALNREYLNVEPGISVRPSFGRADYEAFRPQEMTPARQKAIIKASMNAYDRVGLIRNVIDMMGDFACQGLSIVHEDPKIEKFYKNWFKQVGGFDRSERFINYLYRTGNVIINRSTAKITKGKEEEFKKTSEEAHGADRKVEDDIKIYRREIPWSYEFLNPLLVEARRVAGQKYYFLKINDKTFSGGEINQDNDYLPDYIKAQIKANQTEVLLDMDKLNLYHYKKDDWLVWANPMINPILDDIAMLEKMKLADVAALDGAISNIRLWSLGSLDHKIAPRAAVMNQLRDILASNVGGGTFDLVWGPDLKFTESNSQVYKFLGNQKYEPVLNNIYQGLGISAALTGSGNSGSYTNNYVSIKMFVERLEYGRSVLLQFWTQELELVRKAMKFEKPAQIHFDSIILSDEAAIKNQLVNLVDRSIMSEETLLERFREIPEVEKMRINREQKARKQNPDMPSKMGPFAAPTHREDMAKIGLNSGNIGKKYFDELGLPYVKAPVVKGAPGQANRPKPKKAGPAGGRPTSSKDSSRKKKRVLPRTKSRAQDSSILMWAIDAQNKVSEILTPIYLGAVEKKNVRSLAREEFSQLEEMKLCAFLGLEALKPVDEDSVKSSLVRGVTPTEEFFSQATEKCDDFLEIHKRKPTIEEIRMIYTIIYSENAAAEPEDIDE
jgi:hypothetical protein